MSVKKIQIWDLPLRLFHWLLVFTVIAAYITAEIGGELTDWHGRIGALALGLLTFRIIWGFVGSTHARFTDFFPTPSRLAKYLKGSWQTNGHNPLGALSVFALLGVLATLIGTGLFANDDIAFQGPLYNLIDKPSSDWLTGLHEIAFNVLLVLIVLHLAAIAFYLLIKKINLVKPMVTGSKEAPQTTAIHTGGGKIFFLIAFALSVTIVWGVFSGVLAEYLEPAQSIPANISTPKW